MRMAQIYQPVMLMEILRRKGATSRRNIAKAIASYDESQIEYYEQITSNMVGRVLTKNRGITERDGNDYKLKNFERLSDNEIKALKALCKE